MNCVPIQKRTWNRSNLFPLPFDPSIPELVLLDDGEAVLLDAEDLDLLDAGEAILLDADLVFGFV